MPVCYLERCWWYYNLSYLFLTTVTRAKRQRSVRRALGQTSRRSPTLTSFTGSARLFCSLTFYLFEFIERYKEELTCLDQFTIIPPLSLFFFCPRLSFPPLHSFNQHAIHPYRLDHRPRRAFPLSLCCSLQLAQLGSFPSHFCYLCRLANRPSCHFR